MKIKSLFVAISLLFSVAALPSAVAVEKPTVESFTASKLDVDVTDPDLTIDFEVVVSHPKGLENTSTLLILTNSAATTISVPLIRTDSPINFTNTKVTFKGKITLPRSLTPGVYTYSIDGVRNNIDEGTRYPTGIVPGPVVRTLKSAESGILVRSNGYLNLDYETINGPAFGSQSGISYINAAKYTTVTAPIWKVGETFNPLDYFEVAVSGVELSITINKLVISFNTNMSSFKEEVVGIMKNFTGFSELWEKEPEPSVKEYMATKPLMVDLEIKFRHYKKKN
jgi:hypothetical protein